jgi:dipeptidyl aminopeptidase/acylaminoacyl peptidase
MPQKHTASYGAWKSPITTDALVQRTVGLAEVRVSDGNLYWLEMRPAEGGRSVVVRRSPRGEIADVTPPEFNARTLVHEYGGGAYAVMGSTVFFANFEDQRVYRQESEGEPVAITPEPLHVRGERYADFEVSPDGSRLYCVRETHREDTETRNEIVCLSADASREPLVVAGGHDFVSYPRLSPDLRHLVWTSWDHPQMPWDGTELWIGSLTAEGGVESVRKVAGGTEESIYQPAFSADGVLHFVSDRSGWWNLYRWREGKSEALLPMSAEFGRPQWGFAGATYAFLPDGRLACVWSSDGVEHLGVLDGSGLREIETPYVSFGRLETWESGDDVRLALVAASARQSPSVVAIEVPAGQAHVIKRSEDMELDPELISVPVSLQFPSVGDRTAHAFYYAPRNATFVGPESERPPLIVMSHGGPTGATSSAFRLGVQYWTSRGFAVVDVNYGGSTGYGRAYRERLRGAWGIVDTEDCISAARHLAGLGRVDAARMAIRGGSAGGYTTLCALTFHDVFAAGASHYGVADAEALARDTHKFESRYLDSLIGPYPEERALYRERSPIHFAEQLSCPLLLLQGLEDEIVPPQQAEVMVEALRKRGLPYAYVAFEGEQHGFRRSENIVRAIEAELFFYARVFEFEPADPIEPIVIENL